MAETALYDHFHRNITADRLHAALAELEMTGLVTHEQGSTARFPAPRAKRAVPLREVTWWVLLKEGRVLLEKRPGAGLWGGLLTFPEIAQASWRVRSRRRLPIVEHGFTHFRLRATPILCAVGAARPAKNQRWIALSQAARAAVPTPVKKLLIGL